MAGYAISLSGLTFNKILHHETGDPVSPENLKKDNNWCGVIHLSKVKWGYDGVVSSVVGGNVQIYATPLGETNAKRNELKKQGLNFTDHKVMMRDLGLWKKFDNLKQRACNEEGVHRKSFDASRESNLFYGFTRTGDRWKPTSCTLNTWVTHVDDDADVIKKAGLGGSDGSKDKLMNMMPRALWEQVLPKLETLTPDDKDKWSVSWATSAEKKERDSDETDRMRRFVFSKGTGSKLFELDVGTEYMGQAGEPAVKALVTVLEEEVKGKKRCSHIKRLGLYMNDLTDAHIELLAPMFGLCSNLERLDLSNNLIEDRGVTVLCEKLPKTLDMLYINDNEFSLAGSLAIQEWGKVNKCEVRELK